MAESSLNTPDNTVCQYFLRNICMYGDTCRYSHRQSTPPSGGMCKFYLQGNCRFGEKCWNRHSSDKNCSPSTYATPSKSSPAKKHPEPRTSPSKQHKFALPQSRQQQARNPHWAHAPEFFPSSSKNPIGVPQLCADFIYGRCAEGNKCVYIHGDACELCRKPCLNPLDKNQRREHLASCQKEYKRQQDRHASLQRSLDKTCGICLDVVVEKTITNDRKFGILENCNHIFCFTCIMKWRKVKNRNRDLDSFVEPSLSKACPECRTASDFVTPSEFWFETEAEKKKLIADRKAFLMTKHCKAFKRGEGHCPYGSLCYNLHMLHNGQKVTLPAPSPLEDFRPQDLDFMSRLLLMDFWDESIDFFSSDSDPEDELDELDILYNLDFELINHFDGF